jgi:hypothetical protein
MTTPKQLLPSALFVLLFSALSFAQTAACTNWTFFTVPGAGRTLPNGVNRWDTVVGYTIDSSSHQANAGFIRWASGGFSYYKYPGSSYTVLTRRNAQGVSVGYWADSSNRVHGLVLSGSKGVSVDYPGATSTLAMGINYWGSIVGEYTDSSGNQHGFELKNNKFTTIDYPGAARTEAVSISDKGVIVGAYYATPNGNASGFILENGTYTTLNNPNTPYDTYLSDINSSGTIVGVYFPDPNPHGFIYINGKFKDIVAPNSVAESTTTAGINGYGYVTGETSLNGVSHGYTAHCQ